MFSKFIKGIGEQLSLLISSGATVPAFDETIPVSDKTLQLHLRDGDVITHSDTDIKIDTEGNVFTKVKGRWVPEPDIVGIIYSNLPIPTICK